uniref:Nucleotide modification associated domain-containing protein n=1 Tax=viral metagenome TaxID=1070528 RepID=A0A6H2A189_9ZZZZ
MNRNRLIDFFDSTIARARKILLERNEKRASDFDALSNLRSEALVCGIDVQQHMLNYIGIKYTRLQHAIVSGEDATDHVDDLINYLILLMALKHKETR